MQDGVTGMTEDKQDDMIRERQEPAADKRGPGTSADRECARVDSNHRPTA
jgi:hypothetical protein